MDRDYFPLAIGGIVLGLLVLMAIVMRSPSTYTPGCYLQSSPMHSVDVSPLPESATPIGSAYCGGR